MRNDGMISFLGRMDECPSDYTIKQQMVDELNKSLERINTIFRIDWFHDKLDDSDGQKLQIVPASNTLLNSAVINLSDEAVDMITKYFRYYDIRITWNNTRNIFYPLYNRASRM